MLLRYLRGWIWGGQRGISAGVAASCLAHRRALAPIGAHGFILSRIEYLISNRSSYPEPIIRRSWPHLIPNRIFHPESIVLPRTDSLIPSRLVSSEPLQLSKTCQMDGHSSETQLLCTVSWANRRRRSTRRVWAMHMDVGTTTNRILFLKREEI